MKTSGVMAKYAGHSAWEMAQNGVGSYPHLWRVMTGRKAPSVELAEKIAKFTKTTMKDVVTFVSGVRERAVREDRGNTYIRKMDAPGLGKLAKKLRVKNASGTGSPVGKAKVWVKGKATFKPKTKERVKKKYDEVTKQPRKKK